VMVRGTERPPSRTPRCAGRGGVDAQGVARSAAAVGAVSAAALVCAFVLRAGAPHRGRTELSFSFFSDAAAPPAAAASTFMLPAHGAANEYAADLEDMQATLQADSLKPAGVVGDAPNLLAELGDGCDCALVRASRASAPACAPPAARRPPPARPRGHARPREAAAPARG